MGILPTKAQTIADPLQVHGWILLGDQPAIVFAAFDWCEIRNESHQQWREALATAVGTTPDRVLVSSLHQHDAPVIDAGAQRLLDQRGLHSELFDPLFHADCLRRVSQAAKESLATAKPLTHLGIGMAEVERVASNRRVVYADGRIAYDRYSSSGGDPFHSSTDEGLVDSMLRTITFWSDEQPLLSMHHYAVHPMSSYGRGAVSWDFVGQARDRWMRQAGFPQMYVTGCSGDVTAGKYNDGSTEARTMLADRLIAAMQAASKHAVKHPVKAPQFHTARLRLPFHEDPSFAVSALREMLDRADLPTEQRILAAMGLSSRERWESGESLEIPAIDLGAAQIVLLPGETFVGYQIMASQMRSDSLVMAVGYGDGWTGYVPTDQAMEEGFDHDWRWVGGGCEGPLREALQKVLQPNLIAP